MATGEQLGQGTPNELLSFAPLATGDGLEVVDHVERRHFSIHTSGPVAPEPVDPDDFDYPVDRGVSIRTDHLSVPNVMGAYVRNSLGFVVDELTNGDARTFPRDRYELELPAAVKLYVAFDGAPRVVADARGVEVRLEAPVDVRVGARSHHKNPAATITVADDPADLMVAVSHLSSALKTTTCERSYPTLRGHPPTIERGEETVVPSVLQPADTGVTIEVPREYRSVYVTASLAYYLGADVVHGSDPRIVTEDGFVHPLDGGERGFESEVERVLRQVFFLDCVTRTEGFYQVDLYERARIEDAVPFDFATVYAAPLAGQLRRYLDVPYHVVEPHLPEWKLTAQVTPDPRYADLLPFLVNELAVVRTPDASAVGTARGGESAAVRDGRSAVETFARGARASGGSAPSSRAETESAPTPPMVRVEAADGLEQVWVGDGAPLGASKAMIDGYRNGLGREPADGDIDITVVCNAPEMNEEGDLVNRVYGSRDELPFDVSVERELTTSELEDVLRDSVDFFHYIGHIDADGFECTDGRLDVRDVDHTGVDVFFLNACTSFDQGRHLIHAGSIAGVVTLQDVINSGAQRVGETLARLLNQGFPLSCALEIAKSQSIMGGHYLVLGDGGIDIAQPKGRFPSLCRIDEVGDQWRLEYSAYLGKDNGMGSVVYPLIGDNERHYLPPGTIDEFVLDSATLASLFEIEDIPVLVENELRWSSDVLETLDGR